MVDYLGLLDSQANSHMERRDWGWWVDSYHPDYWVTRSNHDWAVETQVLTSKSFQEKYRLVYHTPNLEVYARTTTSGGAHNQIVLAGRYLTWPLGFQEVLQVTSLSVERNVVSPSLSQPPPATSDSAI